MVLAVELSGEHPALARAEATAVVEALGGRVLEALDRVLLVDGALDPQVLAARLSLAWRVVEVAARGTAEPDALVGLADQVPLDGQRFAVRCSRLQEGVDGEVARRIERGLGTALAERGTVDLEDPEVTVRVLLDTQALVGIEGAVVDRSQYEARHPEERPFFSPVSLHPRLARVLVNLTGVLPGERLWDPFLGTGGLVLEAALVGARAIGSDLDPQMLAGSRKNLAAFGAEAELVEGDVEAVAAELGTVQAIVTDPPYGRASSTNKEDVDQLYLRFFRAAEGALAPGRRLVFVSPREEVEATAPAAFDPVARYDWPVHRSLTRHVFVFEMG